MIFETYKATPGLDRFRPAERFSIYRRVHRLLMREDATYRRHHQQYNVSIIIILSIVQTAAVFGTSSLGLANSLCLSMVPVAVILYLAFQQQHYMNQCIGRVLQSRHLSTIRD
jgi:hypothetical protein